MKIELYELFPVPLVYVKEFLPPELAKNIEKYLLSLKDTTKRHNVFLGDATSSHRDDINICVIEDIARNVEGCERLHENLGIIVNDFAHRTGFENLKLSNSWFNIQNVNSTLKKHVHINNHGNSIASGALYINTTNDCAPIGFDNPNPFNVLFKADPGCRTKFNSHEAQFTPAIGDLLIFPSWLSHGISEALTMNNRIVISFNAEKN